MIPTERTAVFSNNRKYRYRLDIPISKHYAKGVIAFAMLNPSTADEVKNDPTVKRCIGYAERWNYSHLIIINLFALRATNPKTLYTHSKPIGKHNEKIWKEVSREVDMFICAWGNHGSHMYQDFRAMEWIKNALGEKKTFCLDVTKTGQPVHPLYQKSDIEPSVYNYHRALK